MKVIKLSDVMKAIAADKNSSQDRQYYARRILADIQEYPSRSAQSRYQMLPRSMTMALGCRMTTTYVELEAKALELAKKYGIEPVEEG